MKIILTILINKHDLINEQNGKNRRINKHVGKSVSILEQKSKLNKRTFLFIRYLRISLKVYGFLQNISNLNHPCIAIEAERVFRLVFSSRIRGHAPLLER